MFQRLHELSEFLGVDHLRDWELLNHGMEDHYDRGFAICFDERGRYEGVRSVHSSRGVGDRGVVYVPGPGSNSPPLAPCARLSKMMDTKIKYLFQSTSDVGTEPSLPEGWKVWFERIDWGDRELQKRVVLDIADRASSDGVGEKWDEAKGKIRSGYCFPARLVKGHVQPVYELQASKDLMARKAVNVWKTYDGKPVSRNGVCSVCGRKAEVYGNFSELKCYSLDKPGLITGGFATGQSSRNFPVCERCAFSLSYAIRYVLGNLAARMAGHDYLVLPCCSAGGEIREHIVEDLAKRPSRFSISADCDLLVNSDEELLAFMQEEKLKEQLAFSLVFFKERQKEWRIQAEVQQVLPGRMKEIKQARDKVGQDPLLGRSGMGAQPVPLTANTFSLFTRAGGDKAGNRTFYQWMDAVFRGGRIERRLLLANTVKTLLATARRDPQNLHWGACQAWELFLFCSALKLIEQEEVPMTTDGSETPFGRYMSRHPGFFRRKEIAAAFLTGCYVNEVCYAQKKKREMDTKSQAPFAKKFLGRLLSREHLQRLLREGHDKLARYESLGLVNKNGLEADLAQAWVDCDNAWNIGDEEATFAFTIGFSLVRHLVDPAQGKEGDRNQQQEERP